MKSEADQKMELFLEGWYEHVSPGAMFPAGCKLPGELRIIFWEERLEPITIFEAKDLGRTHGKQYAEAIGEQNV